MTVTHAYKPKPMLEKHWTAAVVKLARALGWMVAHFRPGMDGQGRWKTAVQGDGAGFPDLVLVHEKTGAILFVELKRDNTHTSPEQDRWGKALTRDVPATYAVWRPRDLEGARDILSNPHALLRGEPCDHA